MPKMAGWGSVGGCEVARGVYKGPVEDQENEE